MCSNFLPLLATLLGLVKKRLDMGFATAEELKLGLDSSGFGLGLELIKKPPDLDIGPDLPKTIGLGISACWTLSKSIA